jgi:glycosyltransferase involved in cell wall biosynthesis
MAPINVLFDGQVFASQRYGGVSRLFYELISHLSNDEGVRLYLYHGIHINRYPLADVKPHMGYYFGKRSLQFPKAPFFLKYVNNFLFKFAVRRKPVDVYHPTGYSQGTAKWQKSPMVVTVNDMIPERFPGQFRDITSRLAAKKKTVGRADHIIAISRFTRQDLMDFYNVPSSRITVIYPGGPSPVFSPPAGQTAQKKNLRPLFEGVRSEPYVLYVGTRKQGYKNFSGLLSACASVPAIHREFALVCFGGPPFTRAENDWIRRLGLTGRVIHYGGSDNRLADLYRGAAAFIYPSLIEGFGIPPLEAMACGCPVIAADAPPMPEILGDAAVYFDPSADGNLATVMESILFHTDVAQTLVEKGTVQAKKYQWSCMADKTLALYRHVTAKN